MSRIIPDFAPLETNIYYIKPNTAIQAETSTTEPPASLLEFKEILRKFSINFNADDQRKFKQATITAKTCRNNRSTEHYWNLLKVFLIQSIKETHKDVNIEPIKNIIDTIDLSDCCKDNVDNTVLLVYLLGIINGIL